MGILSFTVIQADLHWENAAANRAMFVQKISEIGLTKQVYVLPEMFTTGFSMNPSALAETMEGDTLTWMKNLAAQYESILCGSIIIEENGSFFNRFVWVQPDGIVHTYNKRHLFAYAGEHEHYQAGNSRLIVQANGLKINCNVCYDLRFPVWVRQKYDELYDVLIYVANWPIRRAAAWKSLLVARAIENQCYVIGVNRVGEDGNGHQYNGDTMIIDPLGNIVFHNAKEATSFTCVIDKSKIDEIRTQIPFLKDADKFEIID